MVYLLIGTPMQALHILEVHFVVYDASKEMYVEDPSFGEIWRALQQPIVINQTPFLDYTIHHGCLYKLSQLCVP